MTAEKANVDSLDLERIYEKTKQHNFLHIQPTPLNISNIVVSTKLNINITSNFEHFKEYCELNPMCENIHLSKKSLGKSCVIFKWNQTYENNKLKNKNISVKIFKNGSLHITGITVPDEAVIITECFGNYIQKYKNTSDDEDDLSILSYNLIMIQSTFDIGVTIDLPKLHEIWNVDESYTINNDKHSAIQIKNKKDKTSIFIFSTGKILITGCKNSEQLQTAYTSVCCFFEKNINEGFYEKKQDIVKIPKKRGRKSKMELNSYYNSKKIHLV